MSGFVPWIPVTPATGPRLAVKDVIDVAGWPTGAGHPRWLETHGPAERDAEAVARLRTEFTVIGKTHTDELAYSLAGTNAHYGTPVNPAAPDRIPGGSSSGTAVAVAAGEADLGLGTDTAGSIRVPASYTGLLGLRPTHARASRAGIVPLAPSFDVPGLLARDLVTLRAGAALLLGSAPDTEPPRRLWFPSDLPIEPAVRAALDPAVTRLAAHLELDTTPLFDFATDWERVRAAFATTQGAEVWATHGDWIRREQPVLGPGVATRMNTAAAVTVLQAHAARAIVRWAAGTLLRGLGSDTVLALPSAIGPAPRLGAASDRAALVRLTCLAPICGAPALGLPVAHLDGLPLGLSLLAAPGRDETLLALADRLF